jgi:hypothetical protein
MGSAKKPRHRGGVASLERHLDVARDATTARLREELTSLKRKYESALSQLAAEKQAVHNLTALSNISPKKIDRKRPAGGRRPEATALLVLSDWHVEETVDPDTCRSLNSFSLDIADRRIKQLVEKASMLIEHEKNLTGIRRIVVACLGDLITGHIHEDLVEITSLPPLAASRWAGERLGGVIDAMQEIAPVLVATACGNHSRTGKPRMATEHDHNFEQHIYLMMAAAEKRKTVSWQIGKGYLNMVDLDGFVVRAHHGHAIRFAGGIGGLTIPMNKAIANWNQAQRADLDILGHWHTFAWLPYRFVANGCLIGHNAFADRIKAEYQPPSQSLVIIDHDHNRVTKVLPIFLK